MANTPEERGKKLALCFAGDWAKLNGEKPTEEQQAALDELYPDDPELRREVMLAMQEGRDWIKVMEEWRRAWKGKQN
jgi:hypothetical protein